MQGSGNSVEELQRLLQDERERGILHKQNYQKIKDEYSKLQEELASIYEQLKETRSKNEFIKSAHQSDVRKLEHKIKEQEREINTLVEKTKLLDSKKIRDAVLEEAANHYESQIKELHSETDRIRDQYNNLHYENAILKCNYESRESEYSRALEKFKLEHLVELEQLQSKVKEYEKGKSIPSDTYAVELKSAKREILELNSKIKVLLSECEEVRAQNEDLTLQISGIMRSNSKQSADYANNLRTLESEKIKVMRQLEVCEKELANVQEHRKALNIELQARRQEILTLQTKIEETEHNSRMAIANLQDEIGRNKSECDTEREELVDEITRLRIELRNLDDHSSQEHQIMLIKEQELQKDLISARQQFWKLSNEIQQERERLERKSKELENDRDGHISILNQDVQSLQQKLHSCMLSKVELENELVAMRQHMERPIKNQNNAVDETPLVQTLNYEKEIQDLKQKFQLLAANCNKQVGQRETVDQGPSRQSIEVEKEQELLQMRLTWEQQKLHFHQRLEELESQLRDCKNNSNAEKRELEFKVRQYTSQVSKLREKIEGQKEKLHSQREVLEKYVPAEVHLQVKNQYLELQRRLENYRRLITSEPGLPIKQQSSQVLPNKMLADIKNIDFGGFSQMTSTKDAALLLESNKDIDRNLPKKKGSLPKRKSSVKREKSSQPKSISPVLTSSSDIDWENL